MRHAMFTRIMKGVSIVALLLGFLWNFPAFHKEWSVKDGGYLELLNMVVCLTALLVVAQALRERKYFWGAGFVAIAALFNPIVPVTLSRTTFLWLNSACVVTFLVSLAVWKRRPILPIPPITDRTPGSESA
jgi:hypothetical protein